MASSRRMTGSARWIGAAATLVAGGVMLAAPALGQAAGGAAPAAVLNEGSAYAVSVSGGPSLSARPAVKTRTCPDDQMATLASAESAPVLTTATLDVRVACTATGGSLRSRAVATGVVAGTQDPAQAIKAKGVAAECTVAGGVPKGTTVISGFEAFGRSIGDLKSAEANTPLSSLVPGLSGVVNEQVEADGHISVNAMRLKLGAVEIILGHVECGKGAAAAGVKGAAGETGTKVVQADAKATEADAKAPDTAAAAKADDKDATSGGPTTTKVKGDKDKKDKDEATATTLVTAPSTTRPATTTTRPVTTTTRPAADAGKGGKGLAKTGPVTGALLVLAAAALGVGGLLRLGGEGLPALALARRAKEAARRPRPHHAAASWQPDGSKADDGPLDGPARDALREIDG